MALSYELIMTSKEIQEDREKWLEMRKTGLGGSDAAIVLGISKWKSQFQLWLEKTGQLVGDEGEKTSEYIYWGTVMEELVANRFCELTGKKVKRQGMMRSVEYPWMLADVDRIVGGENAALECKTTASWNASEWEGDNIPDAYYCQLLAYMAVGGYDRMYIACLIGGNKFVWKTVERNEEDIAALIAAESDFWNNFVVPKKLPAADASDKFGQVVSKIFPGNNDEVMELDGGHDAKFARIMEYKRQIKELETLCKREENQVKLMLENATKASSPGYNVYYAAPKPRMVFNTKQFQADYPKLFSEYAKSSEVTRVLRIKEKKVKTEE